MAEGLFNFLCVFYALSSDQKINKKVKFVKEVYLTACQDTSYTLTFHY